MHQLLGAPPTDPDVKVSLIRFLGFKPFDRLKKPNNSQLFGA